MTTNQQNREELSELYKYQQGTIRNRPDGSITNMELVECTNEVRKLIQSAAKEAEEQCKANCDYAYKTGYAKGISTSMNVEVVKQEAREEVLREVIEIIDNESNQYDRCGERECMSDYEVGVMEFSEKIMGEIQQLTTK